MKNSSKIPEKIKMMDQLHGGNRRICLSRLSESDGGQMEVAGNPTQQLSAAEFI